MQYDAAGMPKPRKHSLARTCCHRRFLLNPTAHVDPVAIGVNATGDAGDTSPAIFGQPGTKYLISPAKSVKFLLSHAKRHGS